MRVHFDHLGVLHLGLLAGMLGFLFRDGIVELVEVWLSKPEYSHGFFIPLVSGFMVLQKLDGQSPARVSSSWSGFWLCVVGVVMLSVGQLSAQYLIVQYALLVVLTGLILSCTGRRGLQLLWAPIVLLGFVIPLPSFLFRELSDALQLISSQLGVALIHAAGVSVFLEGNIIDLGTYKLEVVEACSGLRYLFPFASFGFICAYLYRGPWWHRVVLFGSTIPIAIFSNSFRIGAVGLLVEHSGIAAAEGLLHYFEGWVIFMACVGLLIGEMWLLNRSRLAPARFRDVFEIRLPRSMWSGMRALMNARPKPYLISVVLLMVTMGALAFGDGQPKNIPLRTSFVEFPDRIGEWTALRDRLEAPVIQKLGLTDYVLADFENGAGEWVNLYAAYFASQRTGQAAHSPETCIPAGGWRILSFSSPLIAHGDGTTQRVNRVEIEKRGQRQLVYYWFQQRGRHLTNQYWVKAYVVWDAITRDRTDGALVRVTTPLGLSESWSMADQRLARFVAATKGDLVAHIPD